MQKKIMAFITITLALLFTTPVLAYTTASFSTTVNGTPVEATFYPVFLTAPGTIITTYNGTTYSETIIDTTFSYFEAVANSTTITYSYSENPTAIEFNYVSYINSTNAYNITIPLVQKSINYTSSIIYTESGTSTKIYFASTWSKWSFYIYVYNKLVNPYGSSTFISTNSNWSQYTFLTATFQKYGTITSLSISALNNLFTISYTLSGTKSYEEYTNGQYVTIEVGSSTAILEILSNYTTYIAEEPNTTVTVFPPATNNAWTIIYNATTFIITSNTLIAGTYTMIFSSTETQSLQNQLVLIVPVSGSTIAYQLDTLFFPIKSSFPSFIISSYTVSGNTFFVDGEVVYPQPPLFAVAEVVALYINSDNFLYPYHIYNTTYTPIGGYIDLLKISLPTTYVQTTAVISSSTPTTAQTAENIIVTQTNSGSIVTSINQYLLYGNTTLVIEQDKILESSPTLTIQWTFLLYATLEYSNGTLTSYAYRSFSFAAPVQNLGITATTRVTDNTYLTIVLVDLVTISPQIVSNFTGNGVYTGNISSPITWIDYSGGTITYHVYTVIIQYTVTVSSYTQTSTQTQLTTTKIFGLVITTNPDNTTASIVVKLIAVILWLIEALLMLLLMYYAYRYATAQNPEEKKEYSKKIMYVAAAMVIIFILPKALDWIVGA